jgi:hypothetical protein
MDINFLLLLMIGTIKDPILWILAGIIGSNILANSISKKIMYLFVSGFILGFIRLNIYKSFGEVFTSVQTLSLIIICILFMISLGFLLYIIFKLIKTYS